MNEIKSLTKATRLRAIAEHDRIRRQRQNTRGWPLPPDAEMVSLGSRQDDFWAHVDRVADAAHQQRCREAVITRVMTELRLAKERRAVDFYQVEDGRDPNAQYPTEITEDQIDSVCQLRRKGKTIKQIADAVGIAETRAYRLLREKNMNRYGYGRGW